jgi:hypothetical protein
MLSINCYIYIYMCVCVCVRAYCFSPLPPHVPYGLRGLPPGRGRSVTDF